MQSKENVEITGPWAKATRSNTLLNAGCVEAARNSLGGLSLRDSTKPDSPVLDFDATEIHAFFDGIAKGEFGTFEPTV